MRLRGLAGCLVCCAVLGAAPPASADAYDAAFARAIAAKERALDENDPAAWEVALERFAEADRLRATPECKYELAQAALRLRQDDVAVEALEQSLALGLSGPARDKALAVVQERAPRLARLRVSGPPGAEVRVRGRQRGTLPWSLPIVLFAGDSRVEVRHQGQRIERVIDLTPGQVTDLNVNDAFSVGPADAPAPPKTPGSPESPDNTPEPRPHSSNSTGPWLVGIGTGVALAGLGTAIAANGSLSARRRDLAGRCAELSGPDSCLVARPGEQGNAQRDVDSIATWKTLRTTGFVATGLAAVTIVTGIVLWSSSSDDTKAGAAAWAFGTGGHDVWARVTY